MWDGRRLTRGDGRNQGIKLGGDVHRYDLIGLIPHPCRCLGLLNNSPVCVGKGDDQKRQIQRLLVLQPYPADSNLQPSRACVPRGSGLRVQRVRVIKIQL